MHLLLFCTSVLTFVVFIVGAATAFDVRVLGTKSRIFACAFLFVVFLTLRYQYLFPRIDDAAIFFSFGMFIFSLIVFSAAVMANKRKLTAVHSSDVPQHLVTSGPYRHIRHPFYVAYIIAFGSSALASRHIIPAVCAICSLANYLYAARAEEKKFAKSQLAEDYKIYQRETGMFIPRIWRGRAPS